MHIRRYLSSGLLLIILQLFCVQKPLSALIEPENYIDLCNGYRVDKITTLIHAFEPEDTFQLSDHLKAKRIRILQTGAKGRVSYCDWFIRGSTYYGWGSNGKYTEEVEDIFDNESRTHASIHNTRTLDASIGAGYLFTFHDCYGNHWNVGPVAGWSYDHQRLKMEHAKTDGIPDPILDGLVYKNRWSGPWVGVDLSFKNCDLLINSGCEYHWGHWNADWLLDGPDVFGGSFSDHRESHHVNGVLFYLDGKWMFWECWAFGVGFKVQGWKATNGRERPKAGSFSAIGLGGEVDKVKHARWYSCALSIDIGYIF